MLITHNSQMLPSAATSPHATSPHATSPHATSLNWICGLSLVDWLFQFTAIPDVCIYFQMLCRKKANINLSKPWSGEFWWGRQKNIYSKTKCTILIKTIYKKKPKTAQKEMFFCPQIQGRKKMWWILSNVLLMLCDSFLNSECRRCVLTIW